ncbi:MAG: rod shape-determining protein MreD [Rhodobacteraceae bacterium]|nr:rod shape-determining protein MreD [Paracoccaceae bacterium]
MDNLSASRLWTMRASYMMLAAVILFFHLLPLGTLPPRWAWPDLLLLLTFACAMRNPAYVPALSVAAVMLLADLLLQRPPGLYAALAVLGAEQLKRHAGGMRDASFLGEWAAVGMMVIALGLLNRVVLGILMVDQASLALAAIQTLMTVASYPLGIAVLHVLLDLRNPRPGGDDTTGAR